MKRKDLLTIIKLFFFLMPLGLWGEEGNWKRIKSCDDESLVIYQSKETEFRLKIHGKSVDYFLLQRAILPHEVNVEKDFVIPLFKGDGHFKGRLTREGEGEIIFDMHDHGNITFIANRENDGKSPRQELAAWNYRQCRPE